jgi:single-strand DNA-binding protein
VNTFSASARVVADAEVRNAGQSQVCNVRLAVNAGFGDRRSTLWINASIWRGADKLAPLLVKGRDVAVTGELSMREYTGRDGQKGQSLELNVDRLDLIGGREAARVQELGDATGWIGPMPGKIGERYTSEGRDEIPF